MATLLDMVVFLSLSAVLAAPVIASVDWEAAGTGLDEFIGELTAPTWSSHAAGVLGVWLGLWWAYFLVGWGLLGATPGKWLVGLRIVDHRGRCPIGASRAALRLVAYIVASVTLCWGHLLILFRSDRRALHDILAGTRVVRWRRPE